ncbi:MAG: COX15/CtaA family protein [Flavobacteriia bacterium]|nr:COX15/CtaA family protein [Flavobacteriia bacterium]
MTENYSKSVYRWLILGLILISLMVVIGGITRLTHSGLSMVEWKPITGFLPPLSEKEWVKEFEKYQFSPEFKYKHSHFELKDFKKIYFWEYLHRLIARFIGICFILPFIYFIVKKKISKNLMKALLWIFAFGLFQGFLGWFMVKSGLVDNPNVSHYRLAAHLLSALFLLSLLFYVSIFYKNGKNEISKASKHSTFFIVFFILLITQITYGAFVSGLKAGLFYNTYPKMGDSWIPESFFLAIKEKGLMAFLEDTTAVQFVHRTIGILFLTFVLISYFYYRKREIQSLFFKQIQIFLILLLVQVLLGIFTIIYRVPIHLASVHQAMAILLVLQATYLFYANKKVND